MFIDFFQEGKIIFYDGINQLERETLQHNQCLNWTIASSILVYVVITIVVFTSFCFVAFVIVAYYTVCVWYVSVDANHIWSWFSPSTALRLGLFCFCQELPGDSPVSTSIILQGFWDYRHGSIHLPFKFSICGSDKSSGLH